MNLVSVEDIRYLKLALVERLESSQTIHYSDITAARLNHMKFLRDMLERVSNTIERCENDLPVVINHRAPKQEKDIDTPLKATRLYYKDTPGAGKEVYADVTRTVNIVEGELAQHQPILQTEAIFGYEPWIQFEPEERDNMMHQTFNQMVDAWNEKYGESNAETI